MSNATQAREPHGFPGDDDYDEGAYADADALLGALAPAVSWPEIGTTVVGTVLDVVVTDQRDPDGTVRTFDNGDVRRQVVLTLATNDKVDDDDDGERRLFVKGMMPKAFREAAKKAKVRAVRPGDVVTVTYTADGEAKGKGLNPPKLFTVEIRRP